MYILNELENVLEHLKAFWAEMEALDSSVWVLHPERPGLADTKRRIAISNLCSFLVSY